MTESDHQHCHEGLLNKLTGLALVSVLSLGPSTATAICGDGTGADCCPCDCNNDSAVTVDELLRSVNIALGVLPVSACSAGACRPGGLLQVDYLVSCIDIALGGCPVSESEEEECDDGGLCVGGSNAGTPCTAEADCAGEGACFGGIHDLRGCASDDDCAGTPCRKCRPYGGDGCAANCTIESDGLCVLSSSTGMTFPPGPFLEVPLSISGSQVFTIGKPVHGSAPVVLKASAVDIDRIPVSTIACACLRGVDARTCGGTLFGRSGDTSPNCSTGFQGVEACPPDKACAAVHGPGNAGSGFIGCGDPGVDVEVVQDCNGTPGAEPFDPHVMIMESSRSLPADRGSGLLAITSAIGTVVGGCAGTTADYGPDGEFCTGDDPISNRGTPNSTMFTTGSASATVLNPGDFDGDVLGPIETGGQPFTCNNGSISVAGLDLAGAFTVCAQPTVADVAAVVNFICE